MGALLHNVAISHHKDEVGIPDGGKTVCDHKAGAALHQAVHGGLDALLGTGIHAAGGLVQNQDAVICQNGAGDGEQLLLALTYVGSILVQLHLVAAGQGADKVVSVGSLGGGNHFFVGSIQTAIADVLHDGALEQPCVLQHHAEALAQSAAVKVTHIVAIQGDGTGIHIIEAHEQLDHGGLACAGGADDGHLLAGLDLTAEIVDDGLVRGVAEADMAECHLTVDAAGVGPAGRVCLLILFRLVQKFEHPLSGSGHTLQHVGHLRKLLDGLGEVLDVLDEGLNVTDGNGAVCRKNAAHDGHRHVAQIAHKVHNGHHQAGEKLALPCGFVQLIVGGVEVVQHHGLAVEGFDHVVAGVDFFHLTVHNAQNGLLCLEVFLAELDHDEHQHQRDRQDQQGDQGHLRADGQHHDQHADHGGHTGDELGDALVQALAQRVHIVGDAGQHLAHGALFKVGKGQAVDLFADLLAEVVADFLGKAGHEPALNKAEGAAQQVHAQQKQQDAADIHKVDAAGAAQLGDPAGGKSRGGLCQHLRACNIEDSRKNGKYNGGNERKAVAAKVAHKLQQGALEVLGAFGRHASGSWHITHPPFRYSEI